MQLTNWLHNFCTLACDLGHKWVGQTGKVRTFRDKASLFAEVYFCAGIGQRFFLSPILDTVLQRGLLGLTGTLRDRGISPGQ